MSEEFFKNPILNSPYEQPGTGNRNTAEFLGIWEKVNNPEFNYGEFATIRSQAGLNSYKISVKDWFAKTNAIGLFAKAGL